MKAGTTVNFVNKSSSEVHNIVFGPKKYLEQWGKKTDMLPAGPDRPEPGHADRPVRDRPQAAARTRARRRTATGSSRRRSPSGSPIPGLPRSSRVTFSTPGTYKYFCWIHGPDMSGTIVVTP